MMINSFFGSRWYSIAVSDGLRHYQSAPKICLKKREAVSKVNFAAASYFMECYIFD
jgi:hypothetical protein